MLTLKTNKERPPVTYPEHPRFLTKGRLRKVAWCVLGLTAAVMMSPEDSSSRLPIFKPTKPSLAANQPKAEYMTASHPPLIAPCEQPHQWLNLAPYDSRVADKNSQNPLVACLGSLDTECWNVGAPNGTVLCLDYREGSVEETDGTTSVALPIKADDEEFYKYTLYVPLRQCQLAVAAINRYAAQKIRQLPAAGDLHMSPVQVVASGWTTDCLPQSKSKEILAT